MKKFLSMLLTFLFLFCLSACGDDSSENTTEETNSLSQEENEESAEELNNELTEEEIEKVKSVLHSASCLPSQYRQLVQAGAYSEVTYADMINYTFSDVTVTYERYDEDTNIIKISGNYRYAVTDDSFAYYGTVELYVHDSGSVTCRSDSDSIHSYMRAMAIELASY